MESGQDRVGSVLGILMLLLGPAPVKISQWPTFYVSPLVSPLLTPPGDNITVSHHSTLLYFTSQGAGSSMSLCLG